jgi:DNA replication and repair protein RecF
MAIEKIRADNFRNLSPAIFNFSSKINCIFGPNGNGKTNLLELIYFVTNSKSFRKNTDFTEMISVDSSKPEFVVQAVVQHDKHPVSVSGRVFDHDQQWFADNEPLKKKFWSPSVFINPFDSYSFHTSSTFRRHWFDQHFSLLGSDYKKTLNRFTKALRFRNSLLQMGPQSSVKAQILAIDEQFSEYCEHLGFLREEFLTEFNSFLTPTFSQLFSEEYSLKLERQTNLSSSAAQNIFAQLRVNESSDFKTRTTNLGIHRDDYIFLFNGINAYQYCSLGQQKMGFLSLLFAYIELFRYKFNSYPIVLIDDVSGELDSTRWKKLIAYLSQKDFQVLITTANQNFKNELEKVPGVYSFEIRNGNPIDHGQENLNESSY